ncbi:hypothetical protein OMW55_02265 [Sphingomonas sp. BN140010]|uniref:ABC transporter substrate-binding protein n=1 Tax=Sphingomonas arvum TaxID=2992113 RepID=A0ABT3JC28_9SPHN|nr:hypothetical protein [Sphingomonas sp. BN140010]MCW3796635.1 hypothetical protein [Sphingomonas sp. BN140010]
MTSKTSLIAAVAAILVSSITVGSAIAPAQAVNLPVRVLANA